MPEELYNSHDYCLLVDEYEALKLENEELIADKKHLINAAMDGGNTYHYAAHDIGYRDMERKVKALEADYDISNRELLVKQVEIDRLTAELARRDEIIARLKKDGEFWHDAKDTYVDFDSLLKWDKSHEELMKELEGAK